MGLEAGDEQDWRRETERRIDGILDERIDEKEEMLED